MLNPPATIIDYTTINRAAAYRDAPSIVQEAIARAWPIYQWGEAAEIVYAESGNDSLAHASLREDSRGLFQVNVLAHPEYAGADLYDPVTCAHAAYRIYCDAGYSWSPWSTAPGLGLA